MILFQDYSAIVELHEAGNVISIRWLDVHVFSFYEFECTFMILMDKIEQYGVKKLLACPGRSLIHLPDDLYKSVITLLQSGLAHSRIEKVARIYVDKSERDLQCIAFFQDLLNEMNLEIDFQNFEDWRGALAWLRQ